MIDSVAAVLRCSWATAKKAIDSFPEARAAFDVEDSKFCALVKTKLVNAVKAGDKWAIERAADSKARRAGFGIIQRQEIDHTSGGEPIQAIAVRYIRPGK